MLITWRGAFAEPNFRTYFVCAAFSQCGGWLARTTQAWPVLDVTGSPAALGIVTIAQARQPRGATVLDSAPHLSAPREPAAAVDS